MTTDPKNDKKKGDVVSQMHQQLVSDGYQVPENIEEFRTALSDKNTAEQMHQQLISDGYQIPEKFDDFYGSLITEPTAGKKNADQSSPEPIDGSPATQPTPNGAEGFFGDEPTETEKYLSNLNLEEGQVDELQRVAMESTGRNLTDLTIDELTAMGLPSTEDANLSAQRRLEDHEQREAHQQVAEENQDTPLLVDIGKDLQALANGEESLSDRIFNEFGRSVKKTLGYQLPSGAAATVSNLLDELKDETEKDLLFKAIKGVDPQAAKSITKPMEDAQVALFDWAKKHMDEGNKIPLIQGISQVKRPLDVVNFVSGSVGQGMAQIIPAVATRGGSSALQEIGLTYLEGVERIAESKGMTPEDVIRLGLDEAETARAYGTVQALMDRFGAMKAIKTFKPSAVANDLRRRGLKWLKEAGKSAGTEFVTEGAQGASQQLAVGQMQGQSKYESAQRLNWTQIFDEALAGAIGGAGVSTAGTVARKGIDKLKKLRSSTDKKDQASYSDLITDIVDVAKKNGVEGTDEEIKTLIEDGILDSASDQVEDVEVQVQQDDAQEVKSFVDRIQEGEKIDDPDDLQFYDNNKEAIERELQSRTEQTRQENEAENTTTKKRKTTDAGRSGDKETQGAGDVVSEEGREEVRDDSESGAVSSDEGGDGKPGPQADQGERKGDTKEDVEPQPPTKKKAKDSPEENRKKGFVEREGEKYVRQEPVSEEQKGAEISVEFARGVDESGQYAVMEANQLQPSHKQGKRNNLHFIPEAQPKNRDAAFGKAGAEGAIKIADNLDPKKIAAAPNPYSGAPTVNSRGEAIQGNSRADAIRMYWKNNPDDPAGYKQFLIDNADQFGVPAETISKMKQPVLTRMLPVADSRAIELGNYDVKDIETGGQRRIDPKQTAGKISPEGRKELLDVLLNTEGETLSEMIRDKAPALANALYKRNAINSTQLETIINSKTGKLNAKGVEDLSQVFKQFLFEGGDSNIPELYEQLPDRVQKGVEKAIPSILKAKSPLTEPIQNAIIAYNDFKSSDMPSIRTWATQVDMTEGLAPQQIYSPLELYLAERFNSAKTQKELTEFFQLYDRLTTGEAGDMFNPKGTPGISPEEAIKQLTNIEYEGSGQQQQEKPAVTEERAKEADKPKSEEAEEKPKRKSERIKDEIDDLVDELDDILGNSLQSGINPEAAVVGAKIVARYAELGVTRFGEIVSDFYKRYGEPGVRKYFKSLKAGYGSLLATTDDTEGLTTLEALRAANVDQILDVIKSKDDESSTSTSVESDSDGPQSNEQVGESDVPAQPDGDRRSAGERGDSPGGQVSEQGDSSVSDSDAVTDGATSDQSIRADEPSPSERIGRGSDDFRSTVIDGEGVQPDRESQKDAGESTQRKSKGELTKDEKLKLQKEAENKEVITGDLNNIKETLPFLRPEQHGDVLAAEQRFFPEKKEPGQIDKGMMFTNGTGTGKTFTGLGIVKRFLKRGEKNILIVTPTDKKVKDWIEEAENLFIPVSQLMDTQDKGSGVRATTYANFRHNEKLLTEKFGLVVYDESHRINSNQDGSVTAAEIQHKKLTNAPSYALRKAKGEVNFDVKSSNILNDYSAGKIDYEQKNRKIEELEKKVSILADEYVNATKVVFLSATPFSYHKSLTYADGYLFSINQGQPDDGYEGYNAGGSYEHFYMQNFGYRMRYNKLTQPETGVDIGLMEREFQDRLKKEGALVARKLDVPFDYSRDFVLAEDGIGTLIDQGYEATQETVEGGGKRYPILSEIARKKFDYNYTAQLMEAIKAKHAVERAKKHIAAGRQVIIFHSYVNSLPSHPFDFTNNAKWPSDTSVQKAMSEIEEFNSRFPQYIGLDLKGLANPPSTFEKEFGEDAMIFNGKQSKKDKMAAVKQFNDDNTDKKLIVIQMESGKEGISLHDVTGKYPRVVLNLALPVRPTDAVQTEGRAYRVGQQSNAIMEYMTVHTNMEKYLFGGKINERVKTVENLALGHEARSLDIAFKEGYKNYTLLDPNNNQGVGGKESDTNLVAIDEFERSKTYYYARAKKTSQTKSVEGTDYYATPEPVGYKMVEWLSNKSNDSVLEPSAGHGAIARFFTDDLRSTVIEPSYALRADLSINGAFNRVEDINFEDYSVQNKHDGIVMNPPYGSSSKTAWDHTEKALTKHLRDTGRLITLVPDGPSFDKRMEKFLNDPEASKGIYLIKTIKLPSATFKRAGTGVNTQLLIFDKQLSEQGADQSIDRGVTDLRHLDTVEELFNTIKEMEVPGRYRTATTEADQDQGYKVDESTGEITPDAVVKKDYHKKFEKDIWTVKPSAVEYDEFLNRRQVAEKIGGYYSRYSKSFVFNEELEAEKFADFVNTGDIPVSDAEKAGIPNALNMENAKGVSSIGTYEQRVRHEDGKPVKLYDIVKKAAKKYNPKSTIGQGFTSPGSEGTYYGDTGNVRVKGLNNLSVAIHELTHAIDRNNKVIDNFIEGTKPGDPLRKALTDLYVEFYPRASENHPLDKRMIEGYAMLIQKYIETPSDIKKKYGALVDAFIRPDGKYSFDQIGEFIADIEKVIAKYQSMAPIEKFASRIAGGDIRDDYKRKKGTWLKVDEQAFDNIALFEELAKRDGTHMTQEDASLYVRMGSNAVEMAHRNISNKFNKFWAMDKDGQYKKALPFNYKTIKRRLAKDDPQFNDFGGFLAARRYHFDHLMIEDLKEKLEYYQSAEAVNDLVVQLGLDREAAEVQADKQAANYQEFIDRFTKIMVNEGIYDADTQEAVPQMIEDAEEAYNEGHKRFEIEEQMLDQLMNEDLKFANHPLVQLLDNETYDKYAGNKGYSPFKRLHYDELAGEGEDAPAVKSAGEGRISSFIQRKGGAQPILNPFVGAMMNHMEITRKGMKQMVYNKLYQQADKHPDVFLQRVQHYTGIEKQEGVIVARDNYKKVAIKVDSDIQRVIDENFDYYNMHLIESALVNASKLFRAGTTGLYPAFVVSNFLMDQFSAAMNTRNGFVPFISPIKNMIKPAFNQLTRGNMFKDSEEAQYFKEYLYLANTSQTFYSGSAKDTQRLKDQISSVDESIPKKIADFFGKLMDMLAIPGNISEISTRGAEYILARKAGKPQVVALEEAGRVSTPFHHIGRLGDDKTNRVGKTWVRSVPYWNATLQVLRQSLRALGTKEGRARAAIVVSSLAAASVSSTLYMLDLDEDDPRLQTLMTAPPDILTKYLFIPSPYSKELIKIRVPDQFNFLTSMLNMYLIESAGKTKYHWSEYAEAGTAFLPSQINPTNGMQALYSAVPHLFKPGLEVMTNTKTWPNVRPLESRRDKSLPSEYRYNAYTSPLAIELGDKLGYSPKKIDHLLEGHFGRSVKFATGKANYFDLDGVFSRELYMQSSRQVQFMYEQQERAEQKMKAYHDGKLDLTRDELRKLNDIKYYTSRAKALLKDYNEVDEKKYPLKAERIRHNIFDTIRKIEEIEYQ